MVLGFLRDHVDISRIIRQGRDGRALSHCFPFPIGLSGSALPLQGHRERPGVLGNAFRQRREVQVLRLAQPVLAAGTLRRERDQGTIIEREGGGTEAHTVPKEGCAGRKGGGHLGSRCP